MSMPYPPAPTSRTTSNPFDLSIEYTESANLSSVAFSFAGAETVPTDLSTLSAAILSPELTAKQY